MNEPFLKHVAVDILNKYSDRLHRIAIVFPNKRASLFLNQHIYEQTGQTMWGPSFFTISDLFAKHSGLLLGDEIQLVCELYHCYAAHTQTTESLDQFFAWGQVLLSDFDDIDKCMGDATKIFSNLRDLHEYDDVSYLNDEQKALLKQFFANFTDDHNTLLKERFLHVWSQLDSIYHTYKQQLRDKGIAYEGMMLRQVAEGQHLSFDYEEYLFVGFNVVHAAEQVLFKRLKDAGKARFYWDFDTYYMPRNNADHPASESNVPGRFIAQYLSEFPNELDIERDDIYGCYQRSKDVSFVSSPTANMQVQYMSQWLENLQGKSSPINQHTAIVLCDEDLLPTVIHHIPEGIDAVNITTGYPLRLALVSSFISQVIALRTEGNPRGGKRFRMRQVNAVARHPYMQYICDHPMDFLEEMKQYPLYINRDDIKTTDEGIRMLFEDFSSTDSDDSPPAIAMAAYLRRLLKRAGAGAKALDERLTLPLEQEAIYRVYTIVNRLYGLMSEGSLRIDQTTFLRLFNQLLHTTSVPFHGEPAVGLQVMGVLETRNLDFRHLLILSCNEGKMPKSDNQPSFIPHILRKAYGLTTMEHYTSIYAYYFYRMIQRAEDVTILYCDATDDGQKGELSRFMLQMLVEDPYHQVKRYSLHPTVHPFVRSPQPIPKTEGVMRRLHDIHYFSPTAIGRYLRCPLQFFYQKIANIDEHEDTAIDDIDHRQFGTIFHESAKAVYSDMDHTVSKEKIEHLLQHRNLLEAYVDRTFEEQLFHGKHRDEYNGLQLINRDVIVRYLEQLLRVDLEKAPFRIIDCEFKLEDYTLDVDGIAVKMGGIIDRLDELTTDGQRRIRVVDYKTGSNKPTGINEISHIFQPEKIDGHSDYYLQTLLYCIMIRHSGYMHDDLPVSPALFYIQQSMKEGYDPTLKFGRHPIADVLEYEDDFLEGLRHLFRELFDRTQPFAPTPCKERCKLCPYHGLCY